MYKVTVDLTTAARSERIKSGRPIYEHDEATRCTRVRGVQCRARQSEQRARKLIASSARRNENAREDQKRRSLLGVLIVFRWCTHKVSDGVEGRCQFSGV